MNDQDFIRSRILMAVRLSEDKQLDYLERGRKKGGYDVRKYISLIIDAQEYWEDYVDEYVADADAQGDHALQEYLEMIDGLPGLYPFTNEIPTELTDNGPPTIHVEGPSKMEVLVKRYLEENKSYSANQEKEQPVSHNKDHKTDGRKKNGQEKLIEPEPAFWKEVREYTKKHSTDTWKNSRGNPKKVFLEHLLSKKFVGYLASDTTKENPRELCESTIGRKILDAWYPKS